MPAVHPAFKVESAVSFAAPAQATAVLAALAATPTNATAGFAAKSAGLIMEALQTNAERAERYNTLGNQLVQQGDLEAAASAFLSAVSLKSDDANLWNNLGSVRHRQKNYAAAENDYRNALRYDADFVPALGNLAALLMETGREEEASLLTCRAFVLPPLEGKSNEMLGIAYYRLGRSADAAACYRAWLREEPGNPIAKYRLIACSGEEVPARTPDTFVKRLFDEMAGSFDEKLVGKLAYRGPQIVAELVAGQLPANGRFDVLDAGCGTGLCAPLFAPYARRLTGVDISAGMLAKARQHQEYAELHEAELTAWLRTQHQAYDLIVMADTMIYFGDLRELLGGIRQSLRAGGLFAFTTEQPMQDACTAAGYHLKPSGRFGHSSGYLARALADAGLGIKIERNVTLRSEFCQPIHGIAVLAYAK